MDTIASTTARSVFPKSPPAGTTFTPTSAPADLSAALDEVTPQFVAYIRQDYPDYLIDVFPAE
jgi:hypothetical protein